MSEGHVYVCKWAQEEDGLHVWVRGHPEIEGTYANWDEVYDQFWEEIIDATDDGEPVLTFDPPLPAAEGDKELLAAGLALVSGAAYSGSKMMPVELFTGGICPHCCHARGRRNEKPAFFYSLNTPVSQAPQEWTSTASGVYVSELFLGLLTAAERACFDTLPIERPPRSRRKYFEIVPRTFVPFVAHAQRPCDGGSRCAECGREHFFQRVRGSDVDQFVAEVDLPVPLPPVLAVGDPVYYRLCMPHRRAAQLLRHRHARGLRIEHLGVLPPALVERHPPLSPKSRELFVWLRRCVKE